MNPFEEFLYRAGLRWALDWMSEHGSHPLQLLNAARNRFPGFLRSQYGTAASWFRTNFNAAQQASALQGNQAMPVGNIPDDPFWRPDPMSGARYRARIQIDWSPGSGQANRNWQAIFTSTRPPTGQDFQLFVAQQVIEWVRKGKDSPRLIQRLGGGAPDPTTAAVLQSRVVQINQ